MIKHQYKNNSQHGCQIDDTHETPNNSYNRILGDLEGLEIYYSKYDDWYAYYYYVHHTLDWCFQVYYDNLSETKSQIYEYIYYI